MRRRHASRGRSPTPGHETTSSISSMAQSLRGVLPQGLRDLNPGIVGADPLIPNYVMSPGPLAGDRDPQAEVRVDEEVTKPSYESRQAASELPAGSATQRSQSLPTTSPTPSRASPSRPAGLPSGSGMVREVPRPTGLPREANQEQSDVTGVVAGRRESSATIGERVDDVDVRNMGLDPHVEGLDQNLEDSHPDYNLAFRADQLAEGQCAQRSSRSQGSANAVVPPLHLGSTAATGPVRSEEVSTLRVQDVGSGTGGQLRPATELASEGSNPGVLEGLLRGIATELQSLGGRIQSLEDSRSSSARSRQSRRGIDSMLGPGPSETSVVPKSQPSPGQVPTVEGSTPELTLSTNFQQFTAPTVEVQASCVGHHQGPYVPPPSGVPVASQDETGFYGGTGFGVCIQSLGPPRR